MRVFICKVYLSALVHHRRSWNVTTYKSFQWCILGFFLLSGELKYPSVPTYRYHCIYIWKPKNPQKLHSRD